MKKDNDFRTPEAKIKIGEFGYDPNGIPVVSIKKSKGNATEDVPIQCLINMLDNAYHSMMPTVNLET